VLIAISIIGVLAVLFWVAPRGSTDYEEDTVWSGPERLRALVGAAALMFTMLLLQRVVGLDTNQTADKVVYGVLGVPTVVLLFIAMAGWASGAED
jgi:hypothetical protein